MKNLLFIGDVVGKAGCSFLRSKLSIIKRQYAVDVTIVNGENSAQGNGITQTSAESIINSGADIITTGNHAFRRREAYDIFEMDHILRPANYPEGGAPGKGICTFDMGAYSICVINLMGTAFMEDLDNPFTKIDELLPLTETPNIFVDFHAEATSEKRALGHYLAGRVTAVIGTHTHVPTADASILGGHTGYLTDVGMVGAEQSVLGVNTQIAIDKLRLHMPTRFAEAEGAGWLCGVVIGFDKKCGKCTKIDSLIVR